MISICSNVVLDYYPIGISTLGELCKSRKLFMSKLKMYLVTSIDVKMCTCDKYEIYEILFMAGNVI